ncbi:MAG: hypothetical protein P8173_16270 [Gammaproteobacteria bacterium]
MSQAERAPEEGNGQESGSQELDRLLASARDSLTDDMVTRLSATLGGGMDLLDRVNRSGIERALPALTQLLDNGDLPRLVELARLVASAQDSLSDDIVTRLAGTAGDGMDLLDRVNRSGIDRALPAIAELVENGDLQRLVELARLIASAQDSMSDDIVTRLAATVGNGMDLLDRVNRSGVDRALPAITQLVENGDLDRLVSVARVLSSAADSLSEDIVSRLAVVAAEGICLLDKLARNEGLMRLLSVLQRKESQELMEHVANALVATSEDLSKMPPAKGGVSGLWQVAKQPGTQEGLRIVSLLGGHLAHSWRSTKTG